MMEDIYSLAASLKDLLDQDERVLRLNELEEKLENNEEVMVLSQQKEAAISAYSDALNYFAKDAKEMQKFQHEMYLKKEALDNHPLVREYLLAYSKVRDLYMEINEILFSNLSLNLKNEESHKCA